MKDKPQTGYMGTSMSGENDNIVRIEAAETISKMYVGENLPEMKKYL